MNRKRRSPIWLQVTRDELQELYNKSSSIREILAFFGLQNKGSNFQTLKKRAIADDIDTSQFKINSKKNISRQNQGKKQPLENILIQDSNHSRGSLKRRLIKEGLLIEECSKCGLGPEWQGERLALQIEHKNGISNDNRLENLCLMCPNCHSQTPSFAGKRFNQHKPKYNKLLIPENKKRYKEYLHSPKLKRRKVERPSKEELYKLVWSIPITKVAEKFGVTDNSIRKWCRSYGIEWRKGKGYWRKVEVGKIEHTIPESAMLLLATSL